MNKSNIFAAVSICLCGAFFAAVGVSQIKNTASSEDFSQIESRAESSSESEHSEADESSSSDSDETEENELYDTTAVSDAYLSGNSEGLSQLEQEILARAEEILEEIISDGMTDFEKELAVHDWLVYNCTYDKAALGVFGGHSENADNPYGALVNGQAICSGYSTSFQMFMDMLEIPCQTFSASSYGEAHAWNAVLLDDEWYYVDVTWDDPVPDSEGRAVEHEYFNVTSEYMQNTGHDWINNDFPDADSLDYSYATKKCVTVSSYEDFEQAVMDNYNSNVADTFVVFDEKTGIDLTDSDWNDKVEEYAEKLIDNLDYTEFIYYLADTADGECLEIIFQ